MTADQFDLNRLRGAWDESPFHVRVTFLRETITAVGAVFKQLTDAERAELLKLFTGEAMSSQLPAPAQTELLGLS